MNRKIGIIIAALIVFGTCIALICGCGNNAKDNDDMTKEVTLVWYTVGGENSADHQMVIDKVNEYLKQKLNMNIDLKVVDFSNYDNKMNTLSGGGDWDLAFSCSWTFDYRKAIAKGFFLQLDDLLAADGQELKAAVNPVLWKGTRINGKHYVVPTNGGLGSYEYFTFNKKLLAETGIAPQALNWYNADLDRAFAAVAARHPGIRMIGGNDRSYDFDFIFNEKFPGAVRVKDSSLKVINQFADPEFLAVCRKYRAYYLKGWYAEKNAYEDFKAGNLFMQPMDGGVNPDVTWSREFGIPVVAVATMPNPVSRTFNMGGAMTAISATCQNPARAMKFLNLLNTDKYLRNLIGYGIENVHYVKTGPDTIQLTERGKKAYQNYLSSSGNMELLYHIDGEPVVDLKAYNASCVVSTLAGFVFNPEPVKTEISMLSNKAEEYGYAIMTGKVDTDTAVAKYIEAMKASGWDKVQAEMQKQVDAWKAEQDK